MKIKFLIHLVSLMVVCLGVGNSSVFAQGQANNWYFGYGAGLNFSSGSPIALTDGSLNTLEGCATISDEEGRLLLYTDGITVYRADHSIMPNGTGLLGNPSSTQSAIIIPQPDTPGIFYIFTVDQITPIENDRINHEGINYSIVDFTQDAAGVVRDKNINLLRYGAEKLSAVIKSCTDNSVWVVMLSTATGNEDRFSTFYAFELSSSGLNANPVKSSAGFSTSDPKGNLKFSPDGTQLACANVEGGLYLADFNSLTGQVSNSRMLSVNSSNFAPYGVEFSPNNRYLYVHTYNNQSVREPAQSHFSSLIQYDTQAANISTSQFLLDEQNLYRGSLQLGPDGKIYRAMSAAYQEGLSYLSVIDAPNEAGSAANYRDRAVFLGSGLSFQGLPPFNQSLFNELDIIQNNISSRRLNLCDGESYTLQYKSVTGASYEWYRNDQRIAGANDYRLSVQQPVGVTLPYTETYRFVLDLNDGSCEKVGIAEITYYPFPQNLNNVQLVQCEDAATADGLSIFNLNEANTEFTNGIEAFTVTYFTSSTDAGNNQNPIDAVGYENTSPGETLFVRVENPAGCFIVNPLELEVSSTSASTGLLEQCDLNDTGFVEFDLGTANAQITGNAPGNPDINYYLTELGALLEDDTQLLPQLYTNEEAYGQTVYARVENNNACFAISPVILRVFERPAYTMPENAFYCETNFPQPLVFSPDYSNLDTSQNYSYEWFPTGQTTPELETNITGEHTLRITNLSTGCFREETFTVEEKELAIIENIEVTDATDNNTAVIQVSGVGDYEFTLDDPLGPYQDDSTFEGLQPGFHTVYVRSKEGCGTVEQEFSIIGFPRFFTPNGDGYHDFWNVKGISDLVQPGTIVRVFDRYGKLLKELNPTSQGWDGTFKGINLPADDYWFRVLLEDGREFKSHFTLKR